MKIQNIFIITTMLISLVSTDLIANDNIDQLKLAEKIEEESQRIATMYLYKNQRISIAISEKGLKTAMAEIKQDMNALFVKSVDPEQKALIEFMLFTYQELTATINEPYSLENASLIIDYCESVLEAAEYVKTIYKDKSSGLEAQMLISTQDMEYLIERANRYYIAYRAGIKDQNARKQMEETLTEFELQLSFVNKYKTYPEKTAESLKTLNRYWSRSKGFYGSIEANSLPRVVLASTEYLKKSLEELVKYHSAKLN